MSEANAMRWRQSLRILVYGAVLLIAFVALPAFSEDEIRIQDVRGLLRAVKRTTVPHTVVVELGAENDRQVSVRLSSLDGITPERRAVTDSNGEAVFDEVGLGTWRITTIPEDTLVRSVRLRVR